MQKLINFIKNINLSKLFPYVLIFYFVICLLPYIFAPYPTLYWFFVSSSINLPLRLISSAIFVAFSFLVIIQKRPSFNRFYLIGASLLLVILTLSVFISPRNYTDIIPNSVYAYKTFVNYHVGLIDLLGGYASCIIDLIFSYLFLFILPLVSNKKNIKPLLIFVFFFVLFECFYSIIFEKQKYIDTFFGNNNAYAGYDIDISGTFISKNQFGAFLIMGFISGFILERWFIKKRIIKVLDIISLVFISLITIASLCKTAMVSLIFFGLSYFILLLVHLIKKKKIKTLLALLTSFVFVVVAILCISLTGLKNIGFFKILSNFITKLLYKSFGIAFEERFITWAASLSIFKGYHIVLGYPKATLTYALKVGTSGNNGVAHNGFIQQLLYYGIFGLIFLIFIYYTLIKRFKYTTLSIRDRGVYFSALLSVLAFMLTETEILIMSSSLLVFLFNIIFTTIPITNVKEKLNEVKI